MVTQWSELNKFTSLEKGLAESYKPYLENVANVSESIKTITDSALATLNTIAGPNVNQFFEEAKKNIHSKFGALH